MSLRVLQVMSSPRGGVGQVVRMITSRMEHSATWHVAYPVSYAGGGRGGSGDESRGDGRNDSRREGRPGGSHRYFAEELVVTHFLPHEKQKFSPANARKLRQIVKKHRIDVVHCHVLTAGFWCAQAGLARLVPVVYSGHGIRFRQVKGLESRLTRLIERYTMRTLTQVTFLTAKEQQIAWESGLLPRGRGVVVANCIDLLPQEKPPPSPPPPLLRPSEPPEPQTGLRCRLGLPGTLLVGTCGRLHYDNNPDLYLEIAAEVIARAGKPVHFVWIGDGDDRPRLMDQARERGLARYMHFPGQVDNATARRWLTELDLFVMTPRYAGLPLVLLEAMAAGRCVVAPDIIGIQDVVDDGVSGLLYPPADPKAAVELIVRLLLEQPETAARIGEEARRVIEQEYSPEAKMLEGYWQIYTTLAQAAGR